MAGSDSLCCLRLRLRKRSRLAGFHPLLHPRAPPPLLHHHHHHHHPQLPSFSRTTSSPGCLSSGLPACGRPSSSAGVFVDTRPGQRSLSVRSERSSAGGGVVNRGPARSESCRRSCGGFEETDTWQRSAPGRKTPHISHYCAALNRNCTNVCVFLPPLPSLPL